MLVEVQIDEEPVCAEPPLGATAPLEGTTVANITLEKGYFRTSNKSHDILQCYQKRACLGGNDTDDYCAPGYNGPCEKTFYVVARDVMFVGLGLPLVAGLVGICITQVIDIPSF